jgi:multidrug transporter EmrE-like cation transporter
VIGSCSGLYLLKTAQNWLAPAFFAGAALYGCGAVMWLLILRVYPISVAFPIASGALMIGTTLMGFFLLKESISATHLLGMALIIFGIGLLTLKMQ